MIEKRKKEVDQKAKKKGHHLGSQVEKKWLVSLLVNECAIGALLKFLEDTKVGSREEVTKRQVE